MLLVLQINGCESPHVLAPRSGRGKRTVRRADELKEKFIALVVTRTRIEETLLRHLEAFAKGDLDVLMSDYCEDAVLITPDGILRGGGEIETFFEELLANFSPGSTFEVSQCTAERTTAYIVWSGRSEHLDIPFATETFMVRDGRILTQTFTSQMYPR